MSPQNAQKIETQISVAQPISSERPKVLIADDHKLVAEAIGRALVESQLAEALTTNTAESTLELLSDDKTIDVVLLDIRMPGMKGLETIRTLISAAPQSKIVLFSGAADPNFVKQAIMEGAYGLIPKNLNLRALGNAIGLVHSGEVFVPATTGADFHSKPQNSQPQNTLSDHELRILQLTAEGHTNKEIAIYMGVTEMTVKMQLRAIYKKLNAKNRTHAVVVARELSII